MEMIITLGTGMGSALYTDGRLCPGLELGHHPWLKKTYEDYLGLARTEEVRKKEMEQAAAKGVAQTAATFNWDHLYLGGGNTKLVTWSFGRT